MSPTSPSEPPWIVRALRAVAIVLLVMVQAWTALVSWGASHMGGAAEPPSREARHAAAEAGEPVGPIFPAVSGYVDRFHDGVIAVMTVQGPTDVRTDRFTVFRTPDGPGDPADLHPGGNIAVAGAADETGTVLADVIVLRPPQ